MSVLGNCDVICREEGDNHYKIEEGLEGTKEESLEETKEAIKDTLDETILDLNKEIEKLLNPGNISDTLHVYRKNILELSNTYTEHQSAKHIKDDIDVLISKHIFNSRNNIDEKSNKYDVHMLKYINVLKYMLSFAKIYDSKKIDENIIKKKLLY
jgi:hypothetical protein